MKDYHDLYLKCNVLLLADVFEKFINNSLKNYVITPALSWDAMLNITKVELELIPDPDMYLFFEKGMTGGASYISQRYSKANNKYLKSYDLTQESKHIMYLNANMRCLSFFQQVDSPTYSSNSSKGYVLEVDLEYPKELCELHSIL